MAGGGVVSASKLSPVAKKATKFQEIYAFSLITSLFFLWGFSYGLLDVLNKHFQTFFTITKLQSTGLQVAYFGAYIVYSPIAGQFISRFGYKKGIYMGLSLFAAGAMGFFGSARGKTFGGFCGSSFVIASGLATLEVCANSYVTVLGSPEQAAFRLNLAQSFNGLASFIGPLIASKYFFTSTNASTLDSVQYVYIAVACLGVAIGILFAFSYLPEITEEDMADMQEADGVVDDRPIWKHKHLMFGLVCQFKQYTDSRAAQLFSFMQITFTVARFASTPLLRFFKPATLLTFYGAMCTIFTLVAAFTGGQAGLASLYIIFFFESIIYPTTFTLATQDMGLLTKRAAGLMCVGVGGGAVFPPAQGAMADGTSTELSYIVSAIGFLTVVLYGGAMMKYTSNKEKREALNAGSHVESGDIQKEKDFEHEQVAQPNLNY
ncbi:hypothetical protein RQP46_000491 [Phenoliferia psychrophenolica]